MAGSEWFRTLVTVRRMHRRALGAGLLVLALLFGTVPALAQFRVNAKRQLCFYVQERDFFRYGFSPGHASVQFLPINNAQRNRQDLVYGHHPAGLRKVFGGQGRIKQEPHRPWDWKICFEVTVTQYNDAADKVTTKLSTPADYNILTSNCVHWVQSVATTAGLTLPNAAGFLGIQDPQEFARKLAAVGSGGTLGGGTVHQNGTPPTSMGSSADPPENDPSFCSIEGIEEGAFESLESQAAYHGHEPQRVAHPPLELAAGGTLQVTLTNTRLPDAWVVFDWGDGTSRERGSATGTHTFAANGLYLVRALVINDGAFHQLDIPVEVGSGPSTHSVAHTVDDPPDPLGPTPAAPLVPPEPESSDPPAPVPALSVFGLLALTGLLLIGGLRSTRSAR